MVFHMINIISPFQKLQLILLFAGMGGACHCAAQETIRISTGEFPPYLSAHLKDNGIGLRIIKEAFALEGVNVEYGFFPWKRSYKLAQQGEWDASATWGYNDERNKYFYFSDPLYPAVSVFFHLKSFKFDWSNLNDLKGLSIGATETYAYTPELLAAIENKSLNVELISSDQLNLKKLLKGRIDIFPLNIDVAYALLARHFTPQERELITFHPLELYRIQTHLLFSKKIDRNPRLLRLFNKGLKRLKQNGKFSEYFKETTN